MKNVCAGSAAKWVYNQKIELTGTMLVGRPLYSVVTVSPVTRWLI
jgi:hypothetical protein